MQIIINKPEYLLAASYAVSTESTRYYLNGICIQPHAVRGVTMTATDGHRLVSAYDADAESDGLPPEGVILPLSKELLSAIRKVSRKFDAELTYCDGVIRFNGVSYDCAPIDGTFPDWRRVIPEADPKGAPVESFNAHYLADFAKIGAAFNTEKSIPMAIQFSAKNGPALIRFGGYPVLGVLMPMRHGLPADGMNAEWVRGYQAA